MDYIIKTGTDSEGAAVTTTLNVQMNLVWEYSNHEAQNFTTYSNFRSIPFICIFIFVPNENW